jgi:hypothetical protein
MSEFKIGGDLYRPLSVEVSGRDFTVKKINQKRMKELEQLDLELAEFKKTLDPDLYSYRKIDNTYRQLELLFAPEAREAIQDLDVMEATDLLQYVINTIFEPRKKAETPEAEAEKNGPKPGDVTAP